MNKLRPDSYQNCPALVCQNDASLNDPFASLVGAVDTDGAGVRSLCCYVGGGDGAAVTATVGVGRSGSVGLYGRCSAARSTGAAVGILYLTTYYHLAIHCYRTGFTATKYVIVYVAAVGLNLSPYRCGKA